MIKYIYIIILSCFSFIASSQVVFQPKQLEYNLKGVLYETERAYDFKVYNSGISFGMYFGEIESYYNSSYFSIEFATMKDLRERRQNKNVNFSGEGLSSSFIYGKQNSIYMFRFGQGKKKYLTEKAKRKGLAVGISYNYGLSLVLKRPYHIKVVNTEDFDNLKTIRYTEENREQFLNYSQIFGGESFFTGFWSTRPTVGAHGKIGGHFAFGAFDQAVKAVEIGLMVDAFPRRLPILVEREGVRNKFIHMNLYLSVQFGKRK